MSKMSKNTRLINSIIGAGVILLVVLIDQITKKLVVDNMQIGDSIEVIKGVLRITYITNSGSAFGMLANARWVFMVLSIIGISAIIAYTFWQADKLGKVYVILLSLISGGGIGNMIDRMFNGETFGNGVVIDFVDFIGFGELWKWIYNFADACVTVSCAALVVVLIASEIKRLRLNKKRQINKDAQAETAGVPAAKMTDGQNDGQIDGQTGDQTKDNKEE